MTRFVSVAPPTFIARAFHTGVDEGTCVERERALIRLLHDAGVSLFDVGVVIRQQQQHSRLANLRLSVVLALFDVDAPASGQDTCDFEVGALDVMHAIGLELHDLRHLLPA